MNQQKKTQFEKELQDYELELKWDVIQTKDGKGQEAIAIGTQNDPSVGMFGELVSPSFKNISSLQKWWRKNKKKVIKELGD
jgi:hypothetical protein